MKLISAQVSNYKCYRDTGTFELAPGLNVFIGKNDSGKSALLEALSLTAKSAPHRSLRTAPNWDDLDAPDSTFTVTYEVTSADLVECFKVHKSINLPSSPGNTSNFPTIQAMFEDTLRKGDRFVATWQNSAPVAGHLESLRQLTHSYNHVCNNIGYPNTVSLSITNSGHGNSYGLPLAQWLFDHSYFCKAERLNIAETGSRGGSKLEPDARNLGEVLNSLANKRPSVFQKLMQHIREIFPHIAEVRASLEASNTIKVVVSTADPQLDREDLGVLLAHSGTGIGQVLALLYTIVTKKNSHIILIDEPQSFLHPSALRKLFEIIRMYPMHQYLISTHSPLALSLSDDDRMFQVVRSEEGSKVQLLEGRDDLRAALADVGVRFGDIFGADSILWVEGATEESCFPEIIRTLGRRPLLGTAILGVVTTGDLQSRDASRVYEIYDRLSGGDTLLPPAIAFIFDREKLTKTQMDDISRRSKSKVKWLPWRMYENYLIDAVAIASLLTALDRGDGAPVNEDQVLHWLNENGSRKKYFAEGASKAFSSSDWIEFVDGASVLADLFVDLTNNKHRYNKVIHGIDLTRRLIAMQSSQLQSLANFLTETLEGFLPSSTAP